MAVVFGRQETGHIDADFLAILRQGIRGNGVMKRCPTSCLVSRESLLDAQANFKAKRNITDIIGRWGVGLFYVQNGLMGVIAASPRHPAANG
jgi:hypothetical protein